MLYSAYTYLHKILFFFFADSKILTEKTLISRRKYKENLIKNVVKVL